MPANTPPPHAFEELGDEMDNGEFTQIVAPDQLNDEPFVLIDDVDMEDMDGDDDSLLTFMEHSDSVFCCNFNNSGNLAVSGGQDDAAYVWNTETGEVKFSCTGHTDSVIAAQFNHDSSLVCTADMNGIIKVWNVENGTQVWDYATSEITWIAWDPKSNILFCGTTGGDCWKWSVPGDEESSVFPSYGTGTGCGQLFADGTRCAIGYMNGSIRVFDTVSLALLGAITGKEAHTSNVISIACSPDNNLILTGSEEGTAKLIRTSNFRVIKTFDCTKSEPEPEERESVESVGFFKTHPLVATGTSSGSLRIFDISSGQQRAYVDVGGPIVKLICSDTSPVVYVASVGDISLYDGRTAELQKRWIGHQFDILDLALSKDKEKIVAASDNFVCKIFKG